MKIFLVEDSLDVSAAVSRVLTEAFGAEVIESYSVLDSLAALAVIPVGSLDVAVIDLVLDADPKPLHDALVARGVPVVLLSGVQPDALPSVAELRGWHYLAKPVDARSLVDAVSRAIDPERTPEPSPPSEPVMPDSTKSPTAAPPVARPRTPTAPAPSVAVQMLDKLGEIVAVLAFTWLAHEGKLSGELAAGGALVALGVQSIPRGIQAARAGGGAMGASGTHLGVIGLALLSALSLRAPQSDGSTPSGRHVAASAASIGPLSVLALLSLLGALFAGCPATRPFPRVDAPIGACTPGETACHLGAPWRCGPNGWVQADRPCEAPALCCRGRSAVRDVTLHACLAPAACL